MLRITLLLLFVSSITFGQEKKFSLVFLHRDHTVVDPPKAELDKLIAGHQENVKQLIMDGKLIASGPTEGGGGLYLFNSTDKNQVAEWLKSDPGVLAKRWSVEIVIYTPHLGSVCAVKEHGRIAGYELVRYIATTKHDSQQGAAIEKRHDEYLGKLEGKANAISEGVFAEGGGILVWKGELDKKIIEDDPAVVEGLYTIEYKKMFFAKGAFCEAL
jgi:uncharacterized protein YciI